MFRACGYYVHNLLIDSRKKIGKPSTTPGLSTLSTNHYCVQRLLAPNYIPTHLTTLSSVIFIHLSLLSRSLSPVSTVPIINTTREN